MIAGAVLALTLLTGSPRAELAGWWVLLHSTAAVPNAFDLPGAAWKVGEHELVRVDSLRGTQDHALLGVLPQHALHWRLELGEHQSFVNAAIDEPGHSVRLTLSWSGGKSVYRLFTADEAAALDALAPEKKGNP